MIKLWIVFIVSGFVNSVQPAPPHVHSFGECDYVAVRMTNDMANKTDPDYDLFGTRYVCRQGPIPPAIGSRE